MPQLVVRATLALWILVAAHASVHVMPEPRTILVDAGGSGDFVTIQAAVQAAPEGSTIRVVSLTDPVSGSYGTIDVRRKSLVFLGLGSAPVRATRALVADLAADQSVTFRNFEFHHEYGPAPRLALWDCDGTVQMSGCRMSLDVQGVGGRRPILEFINAANVRMDDCVVDGALSIRPAALVEQSRLIATRSSFVAGSLPRSFAVSQAFDGERGATGLELRGRSFTWLGDCVVEGGDGESVENAYAGLGFGSGGDGGTGLEVGAAALCLALDTSVEAGDVGAYYGWGGGTGFNHGAPGVPIVGLAQMVTGEQRALTALNPVSRSDSPITLRVEGVPGEEVTVYGSRSPFFRYLGPLFGVFGLRDPDPALTFPAGTIPAGGVLEFGFDPPLPPAALTDRFDVQAVCGSGPGRFRLSNVESIIRSSPTGGHPDLLDRIHLDASAPLGGNGSSWSEAIRDLGFAMRVAGSSTAGPVELWIAEGRYVPASSGAFILKDGFKLMGGFPSGGGTLAEQDPDRYPAVIDADRNGDDGPGFTQRGDNVSYLMHPRRLNDQELVTVTGVHIEGLSFRGIADWTDPQGGYVGAAVSGTGDISLYRCRFFDAQGPAVAAEGLVHMRNCRVETSERTGIRMPGDGTLTMEGTLFLDCNRLQPASVIQSTANVTTLTNCTLRYCGWTPPSGTHCSVAASTLVRCTGDLLQMRNCIFWDNDCGSTPLSSVAAFNAADIRHCGFEALSNFTSDPTNRTVDPQFTSATESFLNPGSPYIDAGDNGGIPPGFLRDLAGRWRVTDDPATAGYWTGASGRIVDLGAYEYQP